MVYEPFEAVLNYLCSFSILTVTLSFSKLLLQGLFFFYCTCFHTVIGFLVPSWCWYMNTQLYCALCMCAVELCFLIYFYLSWIWNEHSNCCDKLLVIQAKRFYKFKLNCAIEKKLIVILDYIFHEKTWPSANSCKLLQWHLQCFKILGLSKTRGNTLLLLTLTFIIPSQCRREQRKGTRFH